MKNWIFIQARTNSKRFPNKCMQTIDGIPMLEHVYHRCRTINKNVAILIPEFDPLVKWCTEHKIPYIEGPEEDVLRRFWIAAKEFQADNIIRITADCPLLPTSQILFCLMNIQAIKLDFYTNKSFIDGLDVEAMSFRMLEWVYNNAESDYDKEHVTTFIKKNYDKITKKLKWNVLLNIEPILPEWNIPKLSVDTPEDLERVRDVYAKLYAKYSPKK